MLSSYVDAVVIRTFSQQLIDDFAQHSQCPVINGLSDERHPCQALADLLTIEEALGKIEGQHFVYVGDGNNMVTSLATAAALFDFPITLCCPPDYAPDGEYLAQLKKKFPKAEIETVSDPRAAVAKAEILYTDVWASMGQEDEADERKRAFADYQVNGELFALAPSHCRFMHCLPARRGQEVTEDVIESERSIVFQQAENRMHVSKGLLVWLIEN